MLIAAYSLYCFRHCDTLHTPDGVMTKPSEFFVGVLEFFAILLPGAIATAVLSPHLSPLFTGPLVALPKSDFGEWATFLTVSYFTGHLIFLCGSYIDPLYDTIRRRHDPYNNESAYQCATRLRDSLIFENEQKALNTFQWSRSVLIAKCPQLVDDIGRLEADSKFFRSLLIVGLICAIVYAVEGNATPALVAVALMVPCFVRYYERRLKSTTQAYIHVVTLNRLGMLPVPVTATAV